MAVYDPGETATRRLTRRQIEILELVACGLSGKEIAAQLGIKPQTVKNHWLAIRRALGAANNSHAVKIAMDLKLIKTCEEEST